MTGARTALLGTAVLLVLLVLLAPPATAEDANIVVRDVETEPGSPVGGDAVRFPVTLANEGDEPTEPFAVRWVLDGDQKIDEREVPSLAAGEVVTVPSRNWTAAAGDHTIRATADVFDRTPESDETDNVLQVPFTVAEASGARGPVSVLEARLPTPREGASAVAVDGTVYLVGGVNGTDVTGSDPAEIMAFDPNDRTLEATGAALPVPLRAPAAVAAGDVVHVLGGEGPDGLRSRILTYDPAEGNVTVRNASLPEGRCCGGAAWNGTHVLLPGGRGPGGPTDSVLAWRPGSGEAGVLETTLPAPRDRGAVAWDARDLPNAGCPGGCAYVLGGTNASGEALRSIVRYNPQEGRTATVNGRLPPNGSVAGAGFWTGKHAYVVGGEDPPDHLRRVVRYDPVIDIVDRRHALVPTGRHGAAAAWAGDEAFLFGGRSSETLDEVLRYKPGKPDLALRDLQVVPAQPSVGDEVRLRVVAGNVGTVPAGNFTVGFAIDGDPVGSTSLDGLDVNRTLRVSSEAWTATSGAHQATARAVLEGPGSELQRDNNGASHHFGSNEPPSADFTVTIDRLNVTANATPSQDADGRVASYTWEWGDGTTTEGGPVAQHRYAASGNFTITLEVGDGKGATSRTSRSIVANIPPEAAFKAKVTGQSVHVDAGPSSDPDGTPLVSYLWEWGDNATLGSGQTANHTYEEIGIYTITLSVRDALGADAAASKEIEVWGPIPGPGAALAVVAALAAAGLARRRP